MPGISIRGANPENLSEGALCEDVEESDSVPGVQKPGSPPPEKIAGRYLSGNSVVECKLKKIASKAFYHEKDHHNGILFVDMLKPM